jgi:small GTP-binding protein
MNSEQEAQIVLKLLLLGDSSVGKTSILLQYIGNKFYESNISTTGVDYMEKIIDYNKFKIRLQIWDTSGEEKFRAITKNFYRNADGLLVVFDLTKKESYDHIRSWINEAKENNDKLKTILIGNKLDLKDERIVAIDVAKQFAEKNNLKYIETSAKDGTNINESFQAIIDLLFDGKSSEEILHEFTKQDSSLSVVDDSMEVKKKKSCC